MWDVDMKQFCMVVFIIIGMMLYFIGSVLNESGEVLLLVNIVLVVLVGFLVYNVFVWLSMIVCLYLDVVVQVKYYNIILKSLCVLLVDDLLFYDNFQNKRIVVMIGKSYLYIFYSENLYWEMFGRMEFEFVFCWGVGVILNIGFYLFVNDMFYL